MGYLFIPIGPLIAFGVCYDRIDARRELSLGEVCSETAQERVAALESELATLKARIFRIAGERPTRSRRTE